MKLSSATASCRPDDAKGLVSVSRPSSVLGSGSPRSAPPPGAVVPRRDPHGRRPAACRAPRTPGRTSPDRRSTACSRAITETNPARSAMLITSSAFWTAYLPTRTELEHRRRGHPGGDPRKPKRSTRREREHLWQPARAAWSALSGRARGPGNAMKPLWKNYQAPIGSDALRAAQVVNRKLIGRWLFPSAGIATSLAGVSAGCFAGTLGISIRSGP